MASASTVTQPRSSGRSESTGPPVKFSYPNIAGLIPISLAMIKNHSNYSAFGRLTARSPCHRILLGPLWCQPLSRAGAKPCGRQAVATVPLYLGSLGDGGIDLHSSISTEKVFELYAQ